MKTVTLLTKVSNILDRAFKAEIKDQGHSLTGALEASVKGNVQETNTSCQILDYGHILNDGTKSEKIPYSGRTGKGGTSKYIQGLVSFFKLRGLSDKEALGAAFATAAVQKKEGMSTAASKRFSKNGNRQNFISRVIARKENEIDQIMQAGMDDIFNFNFNKQKSETI